MKRCGMTKGLCTRDASLFHITLTHRSLMFDLCAGMRVAAACSYDIDTTVQGGHVGLDESAGTCVMMPKHLTELFGGQGNE
jgi:hypothetical protein